MGTPTGRNPLSSASPATKSRAETHIQNAHMTAVTALQKITTIALLLPLKVQRLRALKGFVIMKVIESIIHSAKGFKIPDSFFTQQN